MTRSTIVLIAALFACAIIVSPNRASAAAAVSVTLSASTVQKGYTVHGATGTFSVALPAHAVSDAARIRLEPFAGTLPSPEGLQPASDVWTVDITSPAPSVPPVTLAKPMTLALTTYRTSSQHQRVFFWNSRAAAWVPLPSVGKEAGRVARAKFTLPFAQVAVFADGDAVEGVGSWFAHRQPDTAASNDFPMGSKLRVTDLDTKKSVDVTVRSRGPFVRGRVIDLAKPAFQKLRSARAGIARMRVERLKG